MPLVLVRNWLSLAIRGLFAILLGAITFVWPGMTVGALVLLFGGYALVDGVTSLVGAIRASASCERWGALLFEGLAGLVAGGITLFWPAIALFVLVAVIGAWSITTGIFEIVAAVRLRKFIAGEWLLALGGLASVIFGVLVLLMPIAGAFVLALWLGAYASVFGVLLIALGFRLRSHSMHFGDTPAMGAPIR
jgi:uncharacterized membrane protein HdeD (DUF308 family)